MSSFPHITLTEISVDQPPPGISPNFVDPQTLAPTIVAVNVVMMTWTLLFVIIRLYANFHAPRGLGIDDYFCLVAAVLAFIFSGIFLSLSKYARHWFDIPPSWFDEYYLKVSFAGDLVVGPTLFFAKSTIFLLYLRLFGIDEKTKHGAWFGLLCTSLLYWTGVPIQLYCSLQVIGREYNVENIEKSTGIVAIYFLVQGVLSVVLDLYIFLLPLPVILGLQLSQTKRLSILGIFGTAILGITAAMVAVIYRVKLITTHDTFFASACVYLCFTCESCVAIIVGSTPAFASFFKGQMPGAIWQASTSSFVQDFRHGASTSKSGLSYASKQPVSSVRRSTIPGGHTRHSGYLGLHDIRHFGECDLDLTRTEIREQGVTPRTFEESVIIKPVATLQLTRQEQSNVEGWDSVSSGVSEGFEFDV